MANPLIDIGNDNLMEISRKLEESHLVYLQTDESPMKLDERRKLEGHIKEFLCLVPHRNKYVFHETADILHRSAKTMKGFSGYRACTAWSAISLYAANLLAQPWRKEYRTLRTFSGYYKHEVETNLIGTELMFEQMGYKHVKLGVMHLEGPIDPDRVSYVSRDSIVAFVECQILKQIWEAVSNNYQISWFEVLQFRENYVCSPEQAIRALNQRFLQKLNYENHGIGYYHAQPMMINSISQGLPYDLAMNNYVPSHQNEYQYLDDPNAMSPYHINSNFNAHYSTYTYLPHVTKFTQNATFNNLPIVTQCRVPTGRLIELDPPHQDKVYNEKAYMQNLEYDQVDAYDRRDRCEYNSYDKKSSKHNDSNSWDFVVQNLESQGYKKNLGEREDVLHRAKQKPVEGKHQTRTLEKRKEKILEEKSDVKKVSETHSILKDFEVERGFNQEIKMKSGNTRNASPGVTKVMESMKRLTVEKEAESEEDANKWNCVTCTYLNTPEREICEMCNKSRHKGNEDVPLTSGSKECPVCTLINEKDAKECAACGKSLKDSPTYI